jgi:prevent-host-death family protein
MSRKSLTITEAREQLTRLPDQFAQEEQPEPVTVTRHGEPVLAILPWDLYESLVETLEILSDPEAMAQFRASVAALERGEHGRELSDVLKELGWEHP